ncbi:MAG: fibronectin type III domain-containing protein [Eubacterium sp.]|nr:fibronectin type III domain-containing protein [Eubacterium sp.]
MKKTLSILLSFVMLISALMPISAFAAKKSEVSAYSVGDTFAVSIQPVDYDAEYPEGQEPYYYAKFTPTQTAYYEFVFADKYTDKAARGTDLTISMLSTSLVDEKGEDMPAFTFSFWSSEPSEGEEMNDPSICGELKAGKTYYLSATNMGNKTFSTSVTIKNHTHHFVEMKMESTVDSEDLKNNEAGCYYTGCDVCNCMYYKINKTIKKVKTISLSTTKYTYNGKAKTPKVTIKDRKGNKISTKNYKVKYSNNKKVGTGKVKITFKNDYEGTYTKTFKINPKGTSLKSVSKKRKGFTAKIKKQATQTSGYQIQYATNSKFSKNKKTVTVKGNKNTSKTVSGLKGGKKYYVRVRTYKTVNGKKYYSSWSKAKTVTTKR